MIASFLSGTATIAYNNENITIPYKSLTELVFQDNKWADISDVAVEFINRPVQLCFTNISVPISAWLDQSSSPDITRYPFRAEIVTNGVNNAYSPDVRFSADEAISRNFAPVAVCDTNKTYIYAKEKPVSTVSISTIICSKVA